jgi:hypothetical protein
MSAPTPTMRLRAFSYQSLRSILKNSLDRQLSLEPDSNKSGPRHENVRGADYYDPPNTFLQ